MWVFVCNDACGPFGWKVGSLVCRFTVFLPFPPFLPLISSNAAFLSHVCLLVFSVLWTSLSFHFPVLGWSEILYAAFSMVCL